MIRLERIEWDDAAYQHFAAIKGEVGPEFYREEVEVHGSSLIAVLEAGARAGSVILRPQGDELVLVAGSGSIVSAKPFGAVLAAIEAHAAVSGYRTLRMHAVRPGTQRAAEAVGYRTVESVLKKDLG
jgi:hypothetical protein